MKKNLFLCFTFILFLFVFHIVSYAKEIQNNISENILRLHILANSDTKEDQNLKLLVRDKILEHMNILNFETLEDSINYILENKLILEQIAKQVILENGYNYNVKVSLEDCFFPMKKYENISLPSGNYLAIRILIGDAIGQNWWCVMFPPLCFSDSATGKANSSSNEKLKKNLSNDSYEIITSDTEFRFKVVDFINGVS